jgi:hypothetical protein
MPEQSPEREDGDIYQKSRRSKIRFKSSHKDGESESHRERRSEDPDRSRRRKRSKSPSHRTHRSRRQYRSREREEATLNIHELDTEEQFRESLFDALADDEGASYWEGVYGQPVNIYSKEKQTEGGKLETMTDEEYADFVRTKMWEKSHQHIVEERKRREEEQKRKREREKQSVDDNTSRAEFNSMVDDALRQGRQRKRRRDWEAAWTVYLNKWDQFLKHAATDGELDARDKAEMPWPVESGNVQDVDKTSVESFFRQNPAEDLQTILKVERVRWHPDKMQQRLRVVNLDASILPQVTAVFQILDNMWTDLRRETSR